jgi:ATP-dependent DNA helicase RecQ
LQVQADLAGGEQGTDKPLSCSAAMLAKVAQLRSADSSAIERLLGDKRAERFGPAFLDVLRDAG